MNIHQQVTLCIDILLVNGNYFLHTISRNIRFRTTASLLNRSKKQLLRRLEPVFQEYHSRGFEIHEVLADNEFQCLEADILLPTRLNLVSRNEHVGDVENSNKYLKQTVRCLLSSTGARRVPKAMAIGAIDLATTCANTFPIDSGISDSLSPSTIVTGRQLLNVNNLKVTFGTFVQIHLHNHPTNTTQPRTINAIALNTSGNTQGSYYFMNLDTGRRMSANKWVECKLNPSVLSNIEHLAELEQQPLMFDGPALYWRTAHGDIPIPGTSDDVSSVAAAPVPASHDVPLYTELQGAHDITDATVIEEDLDDSDESDYEPSNSDDDSNIEYDSDEYDNETSADEGANHALEVQRVTDENQIGSEKVRAEVTGDIAMMSRKIKVLPWLTPTNQPQTLITIYDSTASPLLDPKRSHRSSTYPR